VAYELEVYPDAEEQIDALPPEVRAALGRAMTVLALVPWNGLPYNDDMPDGSMRQLVFGNQGLVTCLILEDQGRVDVLRVQWVG
jgi:hypothetical protein